VDTIERAGVVSNQAHPPTKRSWAMLGAAGCIGPEILGAMGAIPEATSECPVDDLASTS
jgi:hypothetical protein